jgi:uncharacterized phage-associated protein
MVYRKNEKLNSAHTVADYFLLKIDQSAGDTISNLKLQKLCYFAQVASLVHNERSMFDDEIQAWAHGPVVVKLYNRFKKYGWQSIDPTDLKTQPSKQLNEDEMKILDRVWNKLSAYSAKRLEILSHENGPWKEKYTPKKEYGRCTNIISPADISLFYQSNQKPDWLNSVAQS